MKVVLLPRALSRLDEIYDWGQTNSNENAAAKVYNSILDELEILERQPKIAVIEQALDYIEEPKNTVFIATIWDCRQNPDNLLREI